MRVDLVDWHELKDDFRCVIEGSDPENVRRRGRYLSLGERRHLLQQLLRLMAKVVLRSDQYGAGDPRP